MMRTIALVTLTIFGAVLLIVLWPLSKLAEGMETR